MKTAVTTRATLQAYPYEREHNRLYVSEWMDCVSCMWSVIFYLFVSVDARIFRRYNGRFKALLKYIKTVSRGKAIHYRNFGVHSAKCSLGSTLYRYV